MPKKSNQKKKEKIDKKAENTLKELADSLKSPENPKKDLSELEKETKLNLRDFEFHDFMQDSDDVSAPVLERIAGSQARPIFVGGIPQSSNATAGEERESDQFKYMPGQNAADGPKYIDSDSHIKSNAERVDFNKMGRNEFQPEINQEAMFMRSSEAKSESQFQERVWTAERLDMEKDERKSQFEREEERRDKYKPNLPKSR